jgi:hypothetical protein
MLDMNAPDIENWTYGVFVEKDLGLTPEAEAKFREVLGEMFGVGFYVQPGRIRHRREGQAHRREPREPSRRLL